MATVTSNFSELLKPGLLALGREKLGMKPGTVVQVSQDPMFLGYDVTYKHKNYSKSIKISKEMLEDNMAIADYQGMLQQQAAHTHGGFGQALGNSIGAVGGLTQFSGTDSGWTTTATTDSTGTLTVNGIEPDSMWLDEAVERKVDELNKKEAKKNPTKRKNRMTKWFRLNEDMTADYGMRGSNPEPLDDLRQEMAEWLEGV